MGVWLNFRVVLMSGYSCAPWVVLVSMQVCAALPNNCCFLSVDHWSGMTAVLLQFAYGYLRTVARGRCTCFLHNREKEIQRRIIERSSVVLATSVHFVCLEACDQ